MPRVFNLQDLTFRCSAKSILSFDDHNSRPGLWTFTRFQRRLKLCEWPAKSQTQPFMDPAFRTRALWLLNMLKRSFNLYTRVYNHLFNFVVSINDPTSLTIKDSTLSQLTSMSTLWFSPTLDSCLWMYIIYSRYSHSLSSHRLQSINIYLASKSTAPPTSKTRVSGSIRFQLMTSSFHFLDIRSLTSKTRHSDGRWIEPMNFRVIRPLTYRLGPRIIESTGYVFIPFE